MGDGLCRGAELRFAVTESRTSTVPLRLPLAWCGHDVLVRSTPRHRRAPGTHQMAVSCTVSLSRSRQGPQPGSMELSRPGPNSHTAVPERCVSAREWRRQWALVRSRGTTLSAISASLRATGQGRWPVPRGREPRSRDQDRDNDRERKDSRGPRRGSSDEDALRLREEGRSYAAVARSLNLKRSNDALAAFLRALHQRPDAERAELIGRERAPSGHPRGPDPRSGQGRPDPPRSSPWSAREASQLAFLSAV